MHYLLFTIFAGLLVALDCRLGCHGPGQDTMSRLSRALVALSAGLVVLVGTFAEAIPAAQGVLSPHTFALLTVVAGACAILAAAFEWGGVSAAVRAKLPGGVDSAALTPGPKPGLKPSWRMARMSMGAVTGLFFLTAGLSHISFYAMAKPAYTGIVDPGPVPELATFRAKHCKDGLIVVRNYRETSATYRCIDRSAVVFGSWSSTPFIPWPSFVEGRSPELSRAMQNLLVDRACLAADRADCEPGFDPSARKAPSEV